MKPASELSAEALVMMVIGAVMALGSALHMWITSNYSLYAFLFAVATVTTAVVGYAFVPFIRPEARAVVAAFVYGIVVIIFYIGVIIRKLHPELMRPVEFGIHLYFIVLGVGLYVTGSVLLARPKRQVFPKPLSAERIV